MLSEKSQSQKVAFWIFPFLNIFENGKILEMVNRLVVVRAEDG